MAFSETGKMYRMKPFFDSNIEFISTVDMYKVRSFQSDTDAMMEGVGEVEDRLQQLHQRQQRVLTELQQLQRSVQVLAQQRGLALSTPAMIPSAAPTRSAQPSATSSLCRSSPSSGGLQDLVISADPSCAPLSLLVLLRQLSRQHSVLTSTFVHSSAVDTPPKLRTFLCNGSPLAARSNYKLALTLVWKKIAHGPRLMVSPTLQTCIQGEANIARYLSRLLQPSYEDGDISTATQIDEILDMAQQQVVEGSNKERSATLRTLNASLGKGQWLVGGDLSLADVVAWSALQEAKMTADAPANVKKWLQLCAQRPEFEEVVRFLS